MEKELENLNAQMKKLDLELKKEYEYQYVKLNSNDMSVGPGISYDDVTRIGLFIEYRKGIKNSLTEKANQIEELSYKIDLLTKNVEHRQSIINLILALTPKP
jgi:hypothetical protein